VVFNVVPLAMKDRQTACRRTKAPTAFNKHGLIDAENAAVMVSLPGSEFTNLFPFRVCESYPGNGIS